MSYCRFSTNNYKCDVYCYESTNGMHVTHVASNRIVGDCPAIDWSTAEDLYETEKLRSEFMRVAKREPIGGPADGVMYEDDGLLNMFKRLIALQAWGYNVPQEVLDNMLDELEEVENE